MMADGRGVQWLPLQNMCLLFMQFIIHRHLSSSFLKPEAEKA